MNFHHNFPVNFSKFIIFTMILFLLGLSYAAAQPGTSSGECKENIISRNFDLPTTYMQGVPVGTDCFDLCVNQTGGHPDGMFWYPGQDCRAYVKCQNWAAEVWLCPQFEGFDSTRGTCATLDDDPAIKREQCSKPVPASTLPPDEDNITPNIPATSPLPSELPDDLLPTETTSSPEGVTLHGHKHEIVRDIVTIEAEDTTITESTMGTTSTEMTTETAPVISASEETSTVKLTTMLSSTETSTIKVATIQSTLSSSTPTTRAISSRRTTTKKPGRDVLYLVDDITRHVDEDTTETTTVEAQPSSTETSTSSNYVRKGTMDDKKKDLEYAPYYFPGTLLRIRIPKRKGQ